VGLGSSCLLVAGVDAAAAIPGQRWAPLGREVPANGRERDGGREEEAEQVRGRYSPAPG